MERIGSIGEKRMKISSRCKLLCLFLILALILTFFAVRFHTLAATLGKNELSLFFSAAVTASMTSQLEKMQASYQDFVTLTFKDGGEVAAITTDTTRLLSLQNVVCQEIFTVYRSAGDLSLTVPYLWLLGIDFLSFGGPSAHIRILPTRFLHTYYTSEFESAGINQTKHRILFHVEGTFHLMLPQGKGSITVKEQYCMAETVIVGKVPDAYTEINRLTDDIVESEIDDIYDFGANTN